MQSSNKMIILSVVLVVLVGLSIYLWTRGGEKQTDMTVASQLQKVTCPNCNYSWEMTTQKLTEMRRANEGRIVCPQCGKMEAEKQDVQVRMGFGSTPPEEEEGEKAEEVQRPTTPAGSMRPIGG